MKIAYAVLAGLLCFGVAAASESEGLESINVHVSDKASVQRGAGLFMNYCSGCHSLKYLRYSRFAEDYGIDEKDVMKNLVFTGAKFGEPMLSHMPEANATEWFGKAPPDLSLEARAKGADWIYAYLKSFYLDPGSTVGWNNTVFPNASMPNALWELQGLQVAVRAPAEDGEEEHIEKFEIVQPGRMDAAEFSQAARDIATFLTYAAEPAALKREATGLWVVLYLAFFTLLAFFLKKEYWKDVH
jgi:ubiquinol-cytochrome c reductase cytochrome c1 subunit